MKKILNTEIGNLILDDFKSGLSATEISQKYTYPTHTVYRYLRKNGLQASNNAQYGPSSSITKEVVNSIVEYYTAPNGLRKTSRHFNMAYGTVRKLLKRELVLRVETKKEYSSPPSKKPVGEKHWNWKGGRKETPEGYIRIMIPLEHPFSDTMSRGDGYVLEHRLVMAEHLKRPLTKNETVHHKDGNKSNNAIINLQLRQGNHGIHQVFKCCDCGSHNVKAVDL